MNPFIIFQALKDKRSLKIGIISALIITIVYFVFSLVLGLISIGKWYDESFLLIAQFAILKSFSQFRLFDWILFFAFPLTGGLLFANYSFRKCKDASVGSVGLIAGLIAATCPACVEGIKNYNYIYDKYGEKVQIVYLNINPADTAEDIINIKQRFNGRDWIWVKYSPEIKDFLLKYDIIGNDITYIVKDGKIVYADSLVAPISRIENVLIKVI